MPFNKLKITKYLAYASIFAFLPYLALASDAKSLNIANTASLESIDRSRGEPVRIAVAANFKAPLSSLIEMFNSRETLLQSPIQFHISSGATGTLYNQILHGAPFDLFLAADDQHPSRLVEKSLADKDSLLRYTRGQLTLAYPHTTRHRNRETISTGGGQREIATQNCHLEINNLTELKQRLKLPSVGFDQHSNKHPTKMGSTRIAIANPKTAPYGLVAAKLLNKLDQLEEQSKNEKLTRKATTTTASAIQNSTKRYQLIRGKNILHAQQLLFGGHIDFAFLSYAQRHHKSMENYSFCLINADMYPPLTQSMVIIDRVKRSAKTTQTAKAFTQFLRSAIAQNYLQKIGYMAISQSPISD